MTISCTVNRHSCLVDIFSYILLEKQGCARHCTHVLWLALVELRSRNSSRVQPRSKARRPVTVSFLHPLMSSDLCTQISITIHLYSRSRFSQSKLTASTSVLIFVTPIRSYESCLILAFQNIYWLEQTDIQVKRLNDADVILKLLSHVGNWY